jgi:hypothetical protein
MAATPKKTPVIKLDKLETLLKDLSLKEKKQLLVILQQEISSRVLSNTKQQAKKKAKKNKTPLLSQSMEDDAAVYKTPSRKSRNDSFSGISDKQKKEVRRRIKKYEANPGLLIDERTALRLIKKM